MDGVDNIALDVNEKNTSGDHASVDGGTQNEAFRSSLVGEELTQVNDNDDSNKVTQHQKIICKPLRIVVKITTARPGIILVLISAFLFSLQGLFMKMMSTRLSIFQVVAFTMAVLLVGSLLGILVTRPPRPKQPTNYLWIFLCGFAISVSFTTYAQAVTYLDVSDAVALTYASLIFVCILSWVILKEPLQIFDFVFSSLALVGVVFIARPHPLFGQSHQGNSSNKSGHQLIGIAFAFGSALAVSFRTIAYKKVNLMEIDKFFPLLSLGCIGLLSNVAVCTALSQWVVPQRNDLFCAAGSGLSFFFAHLLLVMSLNLEKATIVSIIITFEISFSFLLQFLFLGVSSAWTSYVGSLLLIFASVGITLYKNRTITETDISDQVQNSSQADGLKCSLEIS